MAMRMGLALQSRLVKEFARRRRTLRIEETVGLALSAARAFAARSRLPRLP
jgi:hypothetical protein